MRVPWVFMYHSVEEYQWDPYLITVDPDRFDRQMRWLRRTGRRGVSMRELLDARARGRGRSLVGLTFDDGYADFAEQVVPVLRRYGFTATVFVVAERIGGTNEWEDGGPEKKIMTAERIREVAEAGMEVGSHGLRHIHMAGAPESDVRAELVRSKQILESIVDTEVPGFCYPYGDANRFVVEATRQIGYDYACAVGHSELDSRHAIPRTYVGDRDADLRLTAKRLRHRLIHRNPVPALALGA